jgi:hypothetical protein
VYAGRSKLPFFRSKTGRYCKRHGTSPPARNGVRRSAP